jgi:hypothetical protein
MTATLINGFRRIGVTLGLAISVSTLATSPGLAYSARAQQMCMGDAMRLCSSEIPSIARITACMRRNKANVSPGCRAVMDEMDGTAARAKPAQAPVAARAEQPAAVKPKLVPTAPVEQRPAAAAVAAQPGVVETKPAVAARAEQPAPKPQLAPTAPVEPRPAAAAVVAQSGAVETKPPPFGSFEQRTMTVPAVDRPRVNPFRHLAGRQKPIALSALVRPTATAAPEQRPATAAQAAIEQRAPQAAPAVTAPTASPAIVPSRPVQTATVERRPIAATPPAVRPVDATSAPVARPANAVRRKQKHRQVAAASAGSGYERYIGMAVPIMSLIMSNW